MCSLGRAGRAQVHVEIIFTLGHYVRNMTEGRCAASTSVASAVIGSAEEKRAYFRLLRHLLSEKLQASYKEDQARPLPPRIADLLKTVDQPKEVPRADKNR